MKKNIENLTRKAWQDRKKMHKKFAKFKTKFEKLKIKIWNNWKRYSQRNLGAL